MIHQIFIKDEIKPETAVEITGQLAGMSFEAGDEVDFYFDSEGGYIEPAFVIAHCIDTLIEEGVVTRGIVTGRCNSSAIIPFLSCLIRECTEGASFLIHPVTVNVDEAGDINAKEANDIASSIWDITYGIENHYRSKGVKEEVIKFLYGEDELNITSALLAKGYGLLTELEPVSAPMNMKRGFLKDLFSNRKTGIYKLTRNYKQFKNDFGMDIDEKITNMKNEILAEVKNAIQEALKPEGKKNEDEKEDKKNEGEALTEEEAKSMAPHFRKTPVTVEGQEDIKYIAHPGKDVEKDHFVIPIDKDGKAKMLPEGDYKVNDGDDEFLLHSTGTTAYIHGRGEEGKKNETEEETKPEDKKNETEEITKHEVVTKAPVNRGTSGSKFSKVEREYYLAQKYCGRGAVGVMIEK